MVPEAILEKLEPMNDRDRLPLLQIMMSLGESEA